MNQRRDGSGFLLEPIAALFHDLLDCSDVAQARVPRVPPLAHPSRADALEGFVWAESRIGTISCHFQFHCRESPASQASDKVTIRTL